MKDGRVASTSVDNIIRIYDPSKDYHFDQVIERHSDSIISITSSMEYDNISMCNSV